MTVPTPRPLVEYLRNNGWLEMTTFGINFVGLIVVLGLIGWRWKEMNWIHLVLVICALGLATRDTIVGSLAK